jgi:hypothetical protein
MLTPGATEYNEPFLWLVLGFCLDKAIGSEEEMSDAQTSQGPNDGAAAH